MIHRTGPSLRHHFIVLLKIMISILFQGFFKNVNLIRPGSLDLRTHEMSTKGTPVANVFSVLYRLRPKFEALVNFTAYGLSSFSQNLFYGIHIQQPPM